jgi:3-oxoacyl-[acyl-carrier protein] reductase
MAMGLALNLISMKITPILTYRGRRSKERIDAALKAYVGRYASCLVDLAQPHLIEGLADHLDHGFDYLVDFAQDDFEGLVASADGVAIHRYFESNIAGRTDVIQRVARTMLIKRSGRMVHVSSTAAARPNPGQGFYAAAKQAAEALYKNVGVELASRGITTVSLRPGYVDAGRGRKYLENNAPAVLTKVPLERALAVHEVVDTILFLLSDNATGINATTVTMDGGLAATK